MSTADHLATKLTGFTNGMNSFEKFTPKFATCATAACELVYRSRMSTVFWSSPTAYSYSKVPGSFSVAARCRAVVSRTRWRVREGGTRSLIVPALELLVVFQKTLGAVRDRLQRDLGAFPPDDLKFFVFKLVGCDEELFKLLLNRL
jgi:hypothetical protein